MSGLKNKRFTNWSETYSCHPELYFEPKTREELRNILKLGYIDGKVVRVMGCGQSPSDLPFTNDYLVCMKNFDRVIMVDNDSCQVKVESGITFRQLSNKHLLKHDLALRIVGAISEISVGGAISTATHNSGLKFGTVASYVIELEVLLADGSILKCSRQENSELFLATCCGLGAMGIILTATLQCERSYNLRQRRYAATLSGVLECLNVHLNASDHFRFYWFPHTENVLVDHISRTNEPVTKQGMTSKLKSWFRDYAIGYYALEFVYWISSFIPSMVPKINYHFFNLLHSTTKTRVDRGDKVMNIECLFKQYVNEWAIPIDKTAVVLYELKEWLAKNSLTYVHFPVEVRFVKGEDFYLSPAYGGDSCYINVIMYRPYGKTVPYDNYWAAYQEIMMRAGGRPHWAKTYNATARELSKLYTHYEKWCNLRRKFDPAGLFVNAYLKRVFDL